MMLDHPLHTLFSYFEWCLHAIVSLVMLLTTQIFWILMPLSPGWAQICCTLVWRFLVSNCGGHRGFLPGSLSRWHKPSRTKIHCIACCSFSCPAFQWCSKSSGQHLWCVLWILLSAVQWTISSWRDYFEACPDAAHIRQPPVTNKFSCIGISSRIVQTEFLIQ